MAVSRPPHRDRGPSPGVLVTRNARAIDSTRVSSVGAGQDGSFTLPTGTFNLGVFEIDSETGLVSIETAKRLFDKDSPDAIQLRLDDVSRAGGQLGGRLLVDDRHDHDAAALLGIGAQLPDRLVELTVGQDARPQPEDVVRRSRIARSMSSTAYSRRAAISGSWASAAAPCSPIPTANSDWITPSCFLWRSARAPRAPPADAAPVGPAASPRRGGRSRWRPPPGSPAQPPRPRRRR